MSDDDEDDITRDCDMCGKAAKEGCDADGIVYDAYWVYFMVPNCFEVLMCPDCAAGDIGPKRALALFVEKYRDLLRVKHQCSFCSATTTEEAPLGWSFFRRSGDRDPTCICDKAVCVNSLALKIMSIQTAKGA